MTWLWLCNVNKGQLNFRHSFIFLVSEPCMPSVKQMSLMAPDLLVDIMIVTV